MSVIDFIKGSVRRGRLKYVLVIGIVLLFALSIFLSDTLNSQRLLYKDRASEKIQQTNNTKFPVTIKEYPNCSTTNKEACKLQDFYNISSLEPNIFSGLVSSHDKSGGNKDGLRETSNIYGGTLNNIKNNEWVIFDKYGPGVVDRIWMKDTIVDMPKIGKINFYFDNEPTPRLSFPILNFFKGTANSQFVAPLVGDRDVSSGGYYSYVPLPYVQHLKITIDKVNPDDYGKTGYYQISYRQLPVGTKLSSFSTLNDLTSVQQFFNKAGANPNPSGAVHSGSIQIGSLNSSTPIQLSGEKVVTVFSLSGLTPLSDGILSNIWVHIKWDNREKVDVPLNFFFGSQKITNFGSLAFGMDGKGNFYNYFPMPFQNSASITFENKNAIPVHFNYQLETNSRPFAGNGYLLAAYKKETVGRNNNLDYNLLTANGQGKIVATILSIQNPDCSYIYEGDDRMYIDGSLSPAIYGTGIEDFFNAGLYYQNKEFSLPTHGLTYYSRLPVNTPASSRNFPNISPKPEGTCDDPANEYDKSTKLETSSYRLFLNDTVHFRSSIQFGFEHGNQNVLAADYQSLVFYYHLPESILVKTDELNIGEATSEKVHNYSIAEQTWSGKKSYAYEGEKDDQIITHTGNAFTGSATFTVSINPDNRGVIIRRLLDHRVANQTAEVSVDNQSVGLWHIPGSTPNTTKSWLENDFFIPQQFTEKKSSLHITIKFVSSSTDINEFYYWIFTMKNITNSSSK